MSNRNLLNLVKRIAAHQPEDFVAPLPAADAWRMAVIQSGVPYHFRVTRPAAPGWWVVRPRDKSVAAPVEPAPAHQIVDYLAALPMRRVIALFRLDDQTWLCSPAFPNGEAQRGWNGEPRQLHLITETVQPLDVIRARDMAGTLLYDEIDTTTPQGVHRMTQEYLLNTPEPTSLGLPMMAHRNAGLYAGLEIMWAHYQEQQRLAEEAAQAQRLAAAKARREQDRQALVAKQAELRASLGARIEDSLSFMGAQLLGWNEQGNNIRVRWSYDGHVADTVVNRNLQVEVAGFCLAGTDQQHTLTSIVQVMEEARQAGRTDSAMRQYNPDHDRQSSLKFTPGWALEDENEQDDDRWDD